MHELAGKVTTVIPTFNRADLIRDAVDSALAQDYHPHEVWVIDDGSTDHTATLLQQYGDRIRYIYQVNQGQAAAKNRAIRESDSEFVATLDSDDRWLPGKLAKQVEVAMRDPEVGLVYTDKRKVNGRDVVQASDQLVYTFHRGWVLDQLIENNFVVSTSVLGRRSKLLEAGLFDESLRVAEDYDLWLRMARICKFDFVDEVLVDYRVGNPSIGSSLKSYFESGMKILDDFLATYYDGAYPDKSVVARARANRYKVLGDTLLASERQLRAFRAYLTATRLQPFNCEHYKNVLRSLVPNPVAGLLRGRSRTR